MGERYTVRAKVFDIAPQFYIRDASGQTVGYCRQKLLRFREEVILYTDQSKKAELLRINARNIIDFSATYDVKLPNGTPIGSLRRKGLKSTFIKDEYLVFDGGENQIATLSEDSAWRGMLRRANDLAATVFPQKFHLRDDAGADIATFRQHFNPLVYKLSIAVHREDERLDDLMLISTGVLLAAIEGRQR
ncbi:MAG: hypothetical protein AAFX79_04530 [Planctomycetota bacterium]